MELKADGLRSALWRPSSSSEPVLRTWSVENRSHVKYSERSASCWQMEHGESELKQTGWRMYATVCNPVMWCIWSGPSPQGVDRLAPALSDPQHVCSTTSHTACLTVSLTRLCHLAAFSSEKTTHSLKLCPETGPCPQDGYATGAGPHSRRHTDWAAQLLLRASPPPPLCHWRKGRKNSSDTFTQEKSAVFIGLLKVFVYC